MLTLKSNTHCWYIIDMYFIFNLVRGIIRLIPQGTVDNNLGPDRLAGPKALDPNHCRQSTLWLHVLCLDVLTVHGIELHLFGTDTFPLLMLCRTSDILAVWTTFNVLAMILRVIPPTHVRSIKRSASARRWEGGAGGILWPEIGATHCHAPLGL